MFSDFSWHSSGKLQFGDDDVDGDDDAFSVDATAMAFAMDMGSAPSSANFALSDGICSILMRFILVENDNFPHSIVSSLHKTMNHFFVFDLFWFVLLLLEKYK